MNKEPIIKISGLGKEFGHGENKVVALDDINLTINKGEIFGIIGLSGAGKSTLVRCINLLERPTAGTVSVAGLDMTSLTVKELRKARLSIGMIFQGFNLLMQKTTLENICFPLLVAGHSREEAKTRGREMLETVDLMDKENAYPAQLSGGQKQRVAIARALATKPQVLLCDEATSALDPTTTRSILHLIQELNSKLGITVVVITHEMKVVEQICNRVAIISKSRIQEVGPVSDIFMHPKTQAARSLLFPDGQSGAEKFGAGGQLLRLVYDGNIDRPLLANMVLSCGAPVNIVFAGSKVIDGRIFGHTIIQLPEDEHIAKNMLTYLDTEDITYQFEEGA